MSKASFLNIPLLTSVTKTATRKSSRSFPVANRKLLIKPNQRTARRRLAVGLGWVEMSSAVALVVLVVAFGFYINMINAYASKGYELKNYQAKIKEQEGILKNLMVEQASWGSITKINTLASETHMVPVTQEEFLNNHQLSSR